MLTLRRDCAHQFLQVLRKARLLKASSPSVPPFVRITADGDGLRLESQHASISVSLLIPGVPQAASCAVPAQLIVDCSHTRPDEVTLALRGDRILANWMERDLPVERDYDAIPLEQLPPVPACHTAWAENPSTLLDAFRQGMRSTDPDSTRYALGCVQLDGSQGTLTATDGRQALLQGGFQFPWEEQLLIPTGKLFESTVLPRESAVQIGRTDEHVVLQCGPWTIAFTIQTASRFPDVKRILPAAAAVRTRWQLHPADVQFLLQRLDQLPQDDELHQAVTVDLNGSVAIRSRRSQDSPATELLLRRSQRDGDEVQLNTDRRLLKRALELGFTEIGFTSAEGPAVCRDKTRQFVWALLEAGSTVPPSEDAKQVDSLSEPLPRHRVARQLASAELSKSPQAPLRPPGTEIQPHTTAASRKASSSSRTRTMPKTSAALPTEAELITQLLDLRQQLRAMEQALVTIARQLRARRKQQQLMKSTLASLKQLQTLGV